MDAKNQPQPAKPMATVVTKRKQLCSFGIPLVWHYLLILVIFTWFFGLFVACSELTKLVSILPELIRMFKCQDRLWDCLNSAQFSAYGGAGLGAVIVRIIAVVGLYWFWQALCKLAEDVYLLDDIAGGEIPETGRWNKFRIEFNREYKRENRPKRMPIPIDESYIIVYARFGGLLILCAAALASTSLAVMSGHWSSDWSDNVDLCLPFYIAASFVCWGVLFASLTLKDRREVAVDVKRGSSTKRTIFLTFPSPIEKKVPEQQCFTLEMPPPPKYSLEAPTRKSLC